MHDNAKAIKVDGKDPQPDIIKQAGEIIHHHGVVIFPAKCLYGIAVNAFSTIALNKVFNIKKRPLNKPLLVLIKDESDLEQLVRSIPEAAKKLIKKFWPGDLTIVFKAKQGLPDLLTAQTGKIGIRIPKHPVAIALVKQADMPITGTSANISGQQGCSRVSSLEDELISQSDLILDSGTLKGGKGSTVVDVTSPKIKILRIGEIPEPDIIDALA